MQIYNSFAAAYKDIYTIIEEAAPPEHSITAVCDPQQEYFHATIHDHCGKALKISIKRVENNQYIINKE